MVIVSVGAAPLVVVASGVVGAVVVLALSGLVLPSSPVESVAELLSVVVVASVVSGLPHEAKEKDATKARNNAFFMYKCCC